MKKLFTTILSILLLGLFVSVNTTHSQQLLEGDKNYKIVIPSISPGGDFLTTEDGEYDMLTTLGSTFGDPRLYSDSYDLAPQGSRFEPNIPEVACFEATGLEEKILDSTNLTAHWKFDANASDSSGNNHNGTVYEALGAKDRFDRDDHAFKFNGTNSYIDFGNNEDLQFKSNQERTYTAWVNFKDWDSTLLYIGGWEVDQGVGLIIHAPAFSGGKILVTNMNNWSNYTNDTVIQLDEWYHLAVTYKDQEIIFYLNGEEDGTYINNTFVSSAINPILVGKSSSTEAYFNGFIDEFFIYNRALNQSEVFNLYKGSSCNTGPEYLNNHGMERVCGPAGCYDRARFEIDAQDNPDDTLYGVQVSTDGFEADIKYIGGSTLTLKDADERNINDYKTKADWETPTFNILDLDPETEYSLRITALFEDLTESVPSLPAFATTAIPSMRLNIGLAGESGENINYNPPYGINFDESFKLIRGATVLSSDKLIWLATNSNAYGGITLVQKGQYGGLYTSTGETHTIDSITGDLNLANEGIGLQNHSISQLFDSTSGQGSLGAIAAESDYANSDNNVGIIDTVFSKIYNANGPVHTGLAGLKLKGKVALESPEGEYGENITFVLVAKY
jgi:hypothetical protein